MANNYFRLYKFEEDWDREVRKNLSEYSIKKHEIVNIAINIILAIVAIFVLKLEWYLLPIAFIVCDILLMPLNILFVRVIPNIRLSHNDIAYFTKRNEKLVKLIDKQKKKLDKDKTMFERSVIRNDIEKMEDELLSNEKRIAQLTEEATTVTTVYDKIAKDNREKIYQIIAMLSAYKPSEVMKDAGIDLAGIVEKSKRIKEILKKKPEAVDMAVTTFNLYGDDLVSVLQSLKSADEEEQLASINQLKEVIYEYELHIDRLEDRIKKGERVRTQVDLSVLLREIKKDKEE